MSLDLKDLESYFEAEHKNKIFCTRLSVDDKKFYVLYDYSKKDEIDKFVSNFTEYLPYYVYNADSLESIDSQENISKRLAEISKMCWNGPTVPKRDLKVNGIFGEVFLDFYERIVKRINLLQHMRVDEILNLKAKIRDLITFCLLSITMKLSSFLLNQNLSQVGVTQILH